MEPRDFCYWLQGFCELTAQAPTQQQWDVIMEHLNLVFDKRTSVVSTGAPGSYGPLTNYLNPLVDINPFTTNPELTSGLLICSSDQIAKPRPTTSSDKESPSITGFNL